MKNRKLFIISILLFILSAVINAQPKGERAPKGMDKGRMDRSSSRKSASGGSKKETNSFNGMRISTTHDVFHVTLIEVKNEVFYITFNIPINPTTFINENIIVNGSPLNHDTEVKFNKTGKRVEIQFALPEGEKSSLEFKNVKSYDGEALKISEFSMLERGKKNEYQVPKSDESKKSEKN